MNFQVDLTGRLALVTGAGSGIGFSIAHALGKSGAHVLVNDVVPARAEDAARRVDHGEALAGDVTDARFVAKLKEREVDILVNNAGFQHVAPVEDFPPEMFRRLLEVLLVGPFLLCQAVVPGMKSRAFGRIVNVASVHAKLASAYKAGYVSAKHGLLGLTRVVALETASSGITVNSICPGWVDTPLVRNQLQNLAAMHKVSEEQVLQEVILGPVALKRLLDPAEVAYLTLFLCSDAASAITAQAYTIDGGWTQI